ncbi:hypothetical protein FB451DRAFT_616830 [Mycena latifolia]|nr:hypothetical protein FB451DRAFT_616830 [Mycena latifolia]
MAISPAYAPQTDLPLERSTLNGPLLSSVGYGILLTLAVQTLLRLLQRPRAQIAWQLVVTVVALLALGSVAVAGNAKFSQMTFIDDRDYPGGPNGVATALFSRWANMMAWVSYILMGWLTDVFMLWRFSVFWDTRPWLVLLPASIFGGSVASSLAFLAAAFHAALGVGPDTRLGTAYYALSLALRASISLSIAARILTSSPSPPTLPAGGSRSFPTPSLTGAQTSLTPRALLMKPCTLLIECAALQTVWGAAFVACYACGAPAQALLLPPLCQIQGISALLILLRIAQGRAWGSPNTGRTTTGAGGRTDTGMGRGTVLVSARRSRFAGAFGVVSEGTFSAVSEGGRSGASVSSAQGEVSRVGMEGEVWVWCRYPSEWKESARSGLTG